MPSAVSRDLELARVAAGPALDAWRGKAGIEALGVEMMGGMEEGAAAAADQIIAVALDPAAIMMAVAGQDQLQLVAHRFAWLGPAFLAIAVRGHARQAGEPLQIAEAGELLFGILRVDIGPGRIGDAQDQLRARLHPISGGVLEIVDLRLVDIAFELAVRTPHPPVARQSDGEIAARLLGLPSADHLALAADAEIDLIANHAAPAEQAEKGIEAVIPVVIAGDGVKVRPVRRVVGPARRAVRAIGMIERHHEPVAILLDRRGRIDLVAAEDEQPPARQRVAGQRVFGDEARHREGGIPAVAAVGEIIEPEIAARIAAGIIEFAVGRRRLDRIGGGDRLPLVGEMAEQLRNDRSQPGRGEQAGIVP